MAVEAIDAAGSLAITADGASSARDLIVLAELGALSRRSNLRGAMQLAAHLSCISATGVLVWLALPYWLLLISAMLLHGITLVTMFAPMHECAHRTAFASRTANVAVGWIAGLLSFYNSTYYRYFHGWHHRYTQDPARDPELMFPRASDRATYLREITGLTFWYRRAVDYPALAIGRTDDLPFVPTNARRGIAISMSLQLAIYAAAAGSIAMGYTAALYFWFLPVLLATPLLRAYLIAEHTACSRHGDGLGNTRTTLALFPIRVLMWNMPFHAEHHLFPSVPFHQLPAVHLKVRGRLKHIAPGYIATNRAIFRSM
jgi:fatty acid desaturase